MKAHVKITSFAEVQDDTPFARWLMGKSLDPRWNPVDTTVEVEHPVEYWHFSGFTTDIESLETIKGWAEETAHRFFIVGFMEPKHDVYNTGVEVSIEIYNYYRE